MKKVITCDRAPKAIGPYSQGIDVGNLLFISGQIPIDVNTGEFVGDDIESQTRQVLNNVKAILEDNGSNLESVVKTTVFLQSMDDFAAMNGVYAEFFTENPPARSAVAVAKLPKGALVEIETIALKA